MRVSLLNLNLVARDAVGRNMMDKARLFRSRGDQVRLFVQHVDPDVPEEIKVLCVQCSLTQLIGKDPAYAEPRAHFFASDLYIYDYPIWYELVETIHDVDRGVVIFDYHGVTPPDLWASEEALELLKRSVEEPTSLLRYADYAIGHSAFTHGELIERYSFPAEKAFTFPYAIPLDDFTPGERDPDLVRRYGLEGKKVLLYVGRMAGNKRIDLLIQALASIRREFPETVLLLVGDDRSTAFVPVVEKAKRLIRELGLEEHVIFTGRVDDLPAHYRLADVYVTSSLHEGFCVPLVESMAIGLPIVGSDCTAIPHTLGDAGLTFEPENVADMVDKVLRVLRDPGLAEELRQRGFQRAKSFSWEAFQEHWEEVLTTALADQPAWSETPAPAVEETTPEPTVASLPAPEEREAQYRELETIGDISMRDYVVRSDKPLIGGLIAWVRRNLTSHLKEPYLDPIIDRQVHVNRRLVWAIEAVARRLQDWAARWEGDRAEIRQQLEAVQSRLTGLEAREQAHSARIESLVEQTRALAETSQAQTARIESLMEESSAQAIKLSELLTGNTAQATTVEELREESKARLARDARLGERFEALRASQEDLKARQEVLAQTLWDLRRLVEEDPDAVRQDVKAVRSALQGLSAEALTQIEQLATCLGSAGGMGSGFQYFVHADTVRDAPAAYIRQIYAPLVERFAEAPEVVDIGCGTGAFLELLRDAGISAYGVDLDEDAVLFCQKKGLDVRHEDGLAHLASLPDKSVGGIFAAHLIEHLPEARQWEFVQLCHRKLLYGAPFVLVTPNGASLSIFCFSFYKDLTHKKPLHPEALRFLLSASGFRRIEIGFLSPLHDSLKLAYLDPELATTEAQRQWVQTINQNLRRLNEIVFGDLDCVASAVK